MCLAIHDDGPDCACTACAMQRVILRQAANIEDLKRLVSEQRTRQDHEGTTAMKACLNCTHWFREYGEDLHGQCLLSLTYGESIPGPGKMIGVDAESYQAWVETDISFCCCKWERKT